MIKNVLNEERNNSTEYGCLMAMVPENISKFIVNFGNKIIEDKNLYIKDGEFGREIESHCTIFYGFVKDLTVDDIKKIINNQPSFYMEITSLDKFENNPNFDVVKFKIKSEILNKLHKICENYPNKNSFPVYKPHITIAYVKKDTFPYTRNGLKIKIPIDKICYSPINGNKSYFKLLTTENNNTVNVNGEIEKLEKEWDRLDSMGNRESEQKKISDKLTSLRNKEPLNPNSEKSKKLWSNLKNSLKEIEYPLAKGKDITSYEDALNWKGKIVWMNPDKFLRLTLPITHPKIESEKNIKYRIKNGLPLDFLVLHVNFEKNKVIGHEGRTRATVAKKLGINKVPVLIYTGSDFKRFPDWNEKEHDRIDKSEFDSERNKY